MTGPNDTADIFFTMPGKDIPYWNTFIDQVVSTCFLMIFVMAVTYVTYDDIDYFRNQMDFTWNSIRFKRLSEYVDWLHTQGMKFITILYPTIDSEERN
ncbi:unnamed protein product [Rotaria sordida]|uniref:Glycoside hydrolase family 31 TIM barrel domain-containing protein n=2 Tax=Rotaria sordida TaxID=392033 RepID=A0A819Q9E1_9BILA|nr:unnamed protein product [Rotaria sordida]CAF4021035.1 unnamed protein product [Rotaria sordida]